MPPLFKHVQPFIKVRENWDTVRPYVSNYQSAVSFGLTCMQFIAAIPGVIAHGFTFPRLHPEMDFEDLEPGEEHANEYITPQVLAEGRIAEIEEEIRERAELEELVRLQEAESRKEGGGTKVTDEDAEETVEPGQDEVESGENTQEADETVRPRVVNVTEESVNSKVIGGMGMTL